MCVKIYAINFLYSIFYFDVFRTLIDSSKSWYFLYNSEFSCFACNKYSKLSEAEVIFLNMKPLIKGLNKIKDANLEGGNDNE